jgi:hypothetical protein
MEVSGKLHAPAALPTGRSIRYPLARRVRSGHGGGDRKKSLPLPGIEPRSSRAYPSYYTELSRLLIIIIIIIIIDITGYTRSYYYRI